jgi:hypothetical protein
MTDLPATVITEADLVDLTSNTLQDPSASQATLDSINSDLASKSGWRINLATGEKAVTGATTPRRHDDLRDEHAGPRYRRRDRVPAASVSR